MRRKNSWSLLLLSSLIFLCSISILSISSSALVCYCSIISTCFLLLSFEQAHQPWPSLFCFFPSFGKESVLPLESLESACGDLLDESKLLVVDLLHNWNSQGIFTTVLEPKTSSNTSKDISVHGESVPSVKRRSISPHTNASYRFRELSPIRKG